MSYELKYKKYKAKYLALKSQANRTQLGGSASKSIYGKNIMEINNLSITPSLNETNELRGGSNQIRFNDYARLAKLLVDDDKIEQTAGSETEELGNLSDSDVPSENQTESVQSSDLRELTETPKSDVESNGNENNQPSEQMALSETPDSSEEMVLSETPKSDVESNQTGGKKQAKKNTKYFFEDSDFDLNSTTTDSELSSLDTDTTDSDDDY